MESKKYHCKECGRLVYVRSKGLCPSCREKQRREEGEETMSTRVRVKDRGELDTFFEQELEKLSRNPVSFESGTKIYSPNNKNIAHLFPKRKYKSVATNPDNVVYLTWQEHADFDRYLDIRDLDKIEKRFPKTWKRMKSLLPLVKEQGKLKDFVEDFSQLDFED